MNRLTMTLGATVVGLVMAAAAGSASQNSTSKKATPQGNHKADPLKLGVQKSDSKKATTLGNHKVDPLKLTAQKSDGKKTKKGPPKVDPKKVIDPKKGNGQNVLNQVNLLNHHAVTGNAFNKLSPKKKTTIRAFAKNNAGNLNDQEKGALNKIQSGQQLSTQDRESLTGMLANNPNITREEREALAEALTIDGQAQRTAKSTRFLRVFNSSDEDIRVWVQYHTYTDKNTWAWYPTAPADPAAKARMYEIKPGKKVSLVDGNDKWLVHASRVRVWAKTASGLEINQYQDQDLVLVPEKNKSGEPCYFAAELETYTHTFGASAPAVTGLKK